MKTTRCYHRIISRDVSFIVLCTSQGQLSTLHTSHNAIQFQCGARGSCSQCSGWNGIRLSPRETEETDRDVAGLTEGADCDPWVSQCSSTWARRGSWEKWAGWHRGLKMREMIQSARIDIPGGVQLVVWLLYECLLCTRFLRSCTASRLIGSPYGTKILDVYLF